MLDTAKYRAGGARVFGFFVERFPCFGFRGEADGRAWLDDFARARRLFAEDFNLDIGGQRVHQPRRRLGLVRRLQQIPSSRRRAHPDRVRSPPGCRAWPSPSRLAAVTICTAPISPNMLTITTPSAAKRCLTNTYPHRPAFPMIDHLHQLESP
jgi:hypothetical protein